MHLCDIHHRLYKGSGSFIRLSDSCKCCCISNWWYFIVERRWKASAFVTMKRLIATNASIIRMLIRIAVSLLRTVESIATPCSVKAYERTVECFKLLNRSQFAISSPLSWCSILSAIFLSLFLRSQIVTLNVLLLIIAFKDSAFSL